MARHRRQRIKTGKNSYLNYSDGKITSRTRKFGSVTINNKIDGSGSTITRNLGNGYYDKTISSFPKISTYRSKKSSGYRSRVSPTDTPPVESLIFFVALIAFAPLFVASYYLYRYTALVWQWHTLIAGGLALLPTAIGITLVIKSTIFRIVYFSTVTVAVAFLSFCFINKSHNVIYAIFGALAVLAVGGFYTKAAANTDF